LIFKTEDTHSASENQKLFGFAGTLIFVFFFTGITGLCKISVFAPEDKIFRQCWVEQKGNFAR